VKAIQEIRKGDWCEGFGIHLIDAWLLPARDRLSARLRTAEVKRRLSMLENVVLILISLLLLGYLMYALLKPENF
jgi:K+-transporting ATPase KdpF subunit